MQPTLATSTALLLVLPLLPACGSSPRTNQPSVSARNPHPEAAQKGGPLAGKAVTRASEASFQTVFAVETASALRAALQDLRKETEIRLVAGTYEFLEPIQIDGDVPLKLRLVGQGAAWTKIVCKSRAPLLTLGSQGDLPLQFDLEKMSIEAPQTETFLAGRGEGILNLNQVRFTGPLLATAPGWIVQWVPRDDEPLEPPPIDAAQIQKVSRLR